VVRRGFSPATDGKASVTVKVTGQSDIVREVTMMSPADVVGLGPGQVIRTWPRDGVHNAEPNYLALVELDGPELPWLFSRPDGAGRVHPWLTLVVVDVTDIDDPLVTDDAGTRVVLPADQRPKPEDSWLWTHGQLLGTDTVPDDPARSLSRLVSPRRLDSGRRYLGCVVPTFEGGRQAGLGVALGPDDPLRAATTPGWQPVGDVELPVYHSFRFGTGPKGDFESLVRRLHGVPLPEGLGRRRLRLDHPLSNLPPSGTRDLELHVALRPPGEVTGPSGIREDYVTALVQRLADADYDVSLLAGTMPRVGPPVHGQLPVGTTARAANLGSGTVPPWLDEVNLDPRHRVAAGLGAEVVRRNQEHYVEEAWRQVGDVLAANRLRRRAEFSLAATTRLYERWIKKLDAGDLLTATAPVHPKVGVAQGETIVGRLRDSPLPPAVVSVELRRFARARGALSQGSGWQDAVGVRAVAAVSGRAEALIQRVPLDSIGAIEPPSRVWSAELSKEILGRLVTEGVDAMAPDEAVSRLDAVTSLATFTLPPKEEVDQRLAGVQVDVDRTLSSIGLVPTVTVAEMVPPPPPGPPLVRPPRVRPPHRPGVNGLGAVVLRRDGEDDGPFTRLRAGDVLATVREEPGLVTRVGNTVVIDTVRLSESSRTGRAATTITTSVLEQIVAGTFEEPAVPVVQFALPAAAVGGIRTELGDAIAGMADLVLRPGDTAGRPGRVLDGGLESLRPSLLAALDPQVTIQRAVNSRISALRDGDAAALDDIMAAPDLSEPTYLQLSAISHDWLLPGLDQLPADTTTLVAANLEFIGAFLVGMNHELARELLWREYPTDQRGTYARQFWTHVARRDPDARFDLKQQLHRAGDRTLRGLSRKDGAADPKDPLVLVVKGDLVQRYPGLIICASTTELKNGLRVPRGTPTMPDFVGVLAPDVLLAGFTGLTAEDVWALEHGNDPDAKLWFFFAEHFSEPRFGLDDSTEAPGAPTSWNAAAWQHVPDDATFLTPTSFGASLPKGDGKPTAFAWASSAANQAWITLQFPFRRGIPASRLLPPEAPQ